jgi:hypothetical protein
MKYLYTIPVGIALIAGLLAPASVSAKHVVLPGQTAPQHTIDELCVELSRNLGFRMKDAAVGGDIAKLQNVLHVSGFFKSESTGYFGLLTLQAVKDFQKTHGIAPTGFVGPLTRGKIAELTCKNSGQQGLVISVQTDKDTYIQGEPITMEITAQNVTATKKVLQWNNGCQTSYTIGSYDQSKDMVCTMALTSVEIGAYGSKTWKITYAPSNYVLPVGNHAVNATIINYGSASTYVKVVGSELDKLKVTVPSVGAIWKFGESHEIRWSPTLTGATVDIQLLGHTNCAKDPCPLMLVKPYEIASKVPADQPFVWKVGTTLDARKMSAAAYDVMVCLNDKPRVCATSDVQITIE